MFLNRSLKSFTIWWAFSIVSSDLSARPPKLVNWWNKCPSNVRCHFGWSVESPISSHSVLAFCKASWSCNFCSFVGNNPDSMPLTVDQIASRSPSKFAYFRHVESIISPLAPVTLATRHLCRKPGCESVPTTIQYSCYKFYYNPIYSCFLPNEGLINGSSTSSKNILYLFCANFN